MKLTKYYFDILSSTNDQLWKLIDKGAGDGTVVIAAEQTLGRGQWGRKWESSLGGVYLSIALSPQLSISQIPMLTIAIAVGIAIELRKYEIPVFLKWPNDLILQEQKLGGILTQTKVQEGKLIRAIVGVGVNWINQVPNTGINLESFFKKQGNRLIASQEQLIDIILNGILSGYELTFPESIAKLPSIYSKLLSPYLNSVIINNSKARIISITPTGDLLVVEEETQQEIQLKASKIRLEYF